MSKRAGESFATSASAKQKPGHCSAKIARKMNGLSRSTSTRIPSWRRLQAWKPVSARFWKSHQNDVRNIKLQATGSGWRIKLQATGWNRRSFKWKEVHLHPNTDGEKDIRKFDDPANTFESTKFTVKYWTVYVKGLVNILPIRQDLWDARCDVDPIYKRLLMAFISVNKDHEDFQWTRM